MALVRGTPQLLVETDTDGGLGYESRDGRQVRCVTRDNHAEEHAAMGTPDVMRMSPPFVRSLLASLVATTTVASRASGVVTVSTAPTGHGITTGATFVGFNFFYPGSASLSAGWYGPIISVPDANTITFAATGANFASETVNGGAIYTTETSVWTGMLPAGSLAVGSELKHRAFKVATNSANAHYLRAKIGASAHIFHQANPATTTPNAWSEGCCFVPEVGKVACVSGSMASGNSAFTLASVDLTVAQPLTVTLQLAAQAEFIAIVSSCFEDLRS